MPFRMRRRAKAAGEIPPGVRGLTPVERRRVQGWLEQLPYYRGRLRVLVAEDLVERNGRLAAGGSGQAERMHAASFLPHRRIVLDRSLFSRRRELARILYHEIFHFLWARLGNSLRRSYEEIVLREWQERARGELGWSAEKLKLGLAPGQVRRRSRQWRAYVCESFCDSAAWVCLPGRRKHVEWTLKPRFRRRRRLWFQTSDVLPRLQL